MCQALTECLDRAVESLLSPVPDGMAIVAIGGYGRGELSPHSDVDLMLLHSGGDPSEPAAALFRPLWDAKLRVGHSVRTLGEAASAARERFDTQTTLLTSRLVSGDRDLFSRLMSEVSAVTRARPLRRHLVTEERIRREADPFLLMATDVKKGRGGLRTLHGFEWERRREALVGRFSTDSSQEEAGAREALLRVRNALHAVTGRSHDVFSADLRGQVARWLGTDVSGCSSRLVAAVQTVDGLAARRWPEVMENKPRRVWARVSRRPSALGANGPPAIDEVSRLLWAGEQGRMAFERVWEAGHLRDVLPEWALVRSLPQLAPFHEHPVAAHLWRTVDEMRRLIGDQGHYGRVAAEVDDTTVLLLAAFLHDIGKGRDGDHAVLGAGIAGEFCRRIGVDESRARLVEEAVRHHLLLPMTATRRDLDDPAVIDEIAATVGSLRLLQVLYLLTVADSTATGPTMWAEWKATLVRTLFVRCAARYGADRPVEAGTGRAEVMAASAPGRESEIEAHLDGMPDDYLRSFTVSDVLWHADLVAAVDGATMVGVRSGDPKETAVVVGRAHPGFRRRVAEAFAANGIDVLEARLFSRDDGMLVDVFSVHDDRTGGHVGPDKWDRLRADVEAGLRGDLDTSSKLASRAAAYAEEAGAEPEVRISTDPATGDLVVTIQCTDRIGRLAEILGIFNASGLDIRLAKIDSREGEVIDTFYVTPPQSGTEPGLDSRIAAALRP